LEESELGRLRDLLERGRANDVVGLAEIGPERIREIEPYAVGIRALHSPETGIIDFRRVAFAYGDEVRSRGGAILLGRRVEAIDRTSDGLRLIRTTAGDVLASTLVSGAGLHSDRVAAMTGDAGNQRIIPFRGDYYTFT